MPSEIANPYQGPGTIHPGLDRTVLLRRTLARANPLSLAVLAGFAGILLAVVVHLLWTADWVDRTDLVMARAHRLKTALAELNTGLRGRLAGSNPDFLQRDAAAGEVIDAALADLDRLVVDNPNQHRRLRTLRNHTAQWRSQTQEVIARRERGADDDQVDSLYAQSEALLEGLRNGLEDFIDTEEVLRSRRSLSVRRATVVLVGASCVAALLLGGALTLVTRRLLLTISRARAAALTLAQGEAEALKEGEQRYRLLFEANPHPMWVCDADSLAFLAVNDEAVRHYGYTRAEFLAMTAADIRPAEDVPALHAYLQNHLDQTDTHAGGWRHRTKDGTIISVEITSSSLEFAGRPARVVLVKDVTARRQAEQALLLTTDTLQALADAMTTFLRTGDWGEATARLLACALHQTDSVCGFTGVVVDGPALRILASAGITRNPAVDHGLSVEARRTDHEHGSLEYTNLNNLFGRVIAAGEPVRANDPAIDPQAGDRLSTGHPALLSFLGVPMLPGAEVVGIIGVANRPGGYSDQDQTKLQVLGQAASVLFDNYHRQQREAALETERRQAEAALRESEEQFRQMAENIGEIVWMCNPDVSQMLYINPAYEKITGCTCQSLYEQPRSFLDAVHPGDRPRILAAVGDMALEGHFDAEYRIVRPDESVRWVRARAFPIRDAAGHLYRIVGVVLDITERKELERRLVEQVGRANGLNDVLVRQQQELAEANTQLTKLAMADVLTGLKNRRHFDEALQGAFAAALRSGVPFSLLMLDLDGFKDYNDAHGHPAGDEVLRQVAKILSRNVRGSDLVARYGGEELVLLLPATDALASGELAERLRVAIAAFPWTLRPVTASFGLATLAPGVGRPSDLVAQADQALYDSKQRGRNRTTHFQDLPPPRETVHRESTTSAGNGVVRRHQDFGGVGARCESGATPCLSPQTPSAQG